jgi:hypothetical protein
MIGVVFLFPLVPSCAFRKMLLFSKKQSKKRNATNDQSDKAKLQKT